MFIALLLAITIVPAAQDASPQKLFESGKYQEAIDSVKNRSDASPEDVYVRALAHRKLNQNDDAKEAFRALAGRDGAWKEIGNSGTAMIEGNMDSAAAAARKAVDADGNSSEARFQLGLVESARNKQQQPMMATFPQSSVLEPADDTPPDKNGAASVDLRSPETVNAVR